MKEYIEREIERRMKDFRNRGKWLIICFAIFVVVEAIILYFHDYRTECLDNFILQKTASIMNGWWVLIGTYAIVVIPFLIWLSKAKEMWNLEEKKKLFEI